MKNLDLVLKVLCSFLIFSLAGTVFSALNPILMVPSSVAGLAFGWVRLIELVVTLYFVYGTWQLKGGALWVRLIILLACMWARPLANYLTELYQYLPTV